MSSRLEELVALSRRLGEPAADLAILAEGNTSCRDGNRFWVKASGHSLREIDKGGFVQCEFDQLNAAFGRNLSDEEVRETLLRSTVAGSLQRPSVEAFMHSWLLTVPGVEFVGHVHPTACLALLCTPGSQILCRMRFFPDEVVCCGATSAWVPYVDPGLPLAEKIAASVTSFIREQGEPPKVIWLQNHGIIALGRTAHEVESALLMTAKAAQVVLLGGGLKAVEKEMIVPLTAAAVNRIRTRPDEHYRQSLLWNQSEK